MQEENQGGVNTAKCLNLEIWGHKRGRWSCTQQKSAPMGAETKPAPGCMPVCQARAPAATSPCQHRLFPVSRKSELRKARVCYLHIRPGKESLLAAGAAGLPWYR